MSEDKISVQDTYDFSKNIENISLSTTYIYGLEQLMIYFMEKMENPANIKPYFKKFESYIKGELDVESNPWTEEESQLYTIFSLQQLLKAKAYEQGLNVKVNATIDNALVQDLMQALSDGKYDEVGEINKKMQDQINKQLS
jgi:hypothetical protein